MANQKALTFYEKLIRSPETLTWKDVFSGIGEKHNRRDADYAMIAGTTLDTVQSEVGMLQKWQRPWLFRKALALGLAAILALSGGIFIVMLFQNGFCDYPALNLLLLVLSPCVVPVSLMLFFWELNAPRDISLSELIGYFFTGGIFSIVVTVLLNRYYGSGYVYLAPVTEEPGKFVLSQLFLMRIFRKRGKVYGLTGLVIGAAVGAGFSAFESAQYAYQSFYQTQSNLYGVGFLAFSPETLWPTMFNLLIRSVFSVCGHVLYCAPYSCFAALHMSENGNPLSALVHMDFWLAFGISFFSHMFWNTDILASFYAPILVKAGIVTIVLWMSVRFGLRKSFAQISAKVQTASSGSAVLTVLHIQGKTGVHAGISFAITKPEILIGSDASCHLNYPVSTQGIASRHCRLIVRNGQLYLADEGSVAGTFLNGVKLHPGTGHLLKNGDIFTLGSGEQSFSVI